MLALAIEGFRKSSGVGDPAILSSEPRFSIASLRRWLSSEQHSCGMVRVNAVDARAQLAEQEPLELRAPRKVANGERLTTEEEGFLVFGNLDKL
jgi:hypothetical protein